MEVSNEKTITQTFSKQEEIFEIYASIVLCSGFFGLYTRSLNVALGVAFGLFFFKMLIWVCSRFIAQTLLSKNECEVKLEN